MKEKRLLEPQKISAGLISGTKGEHAPRELLWATPTDRVADVLAKMDEAGITQLPVLEEGRPVGSLRENHLLTKVVRNRDLLESKVRDVMEASFPTVDVDAGSDEVTRRLRTNAAVLVEEYGRIVGIITRHDVLDMTTKG
jgi:predicted transcriptional regulator